MNLRKQRSAEHYDRILTRYTEAGKSEILKAWLEQAVREIFPSLDSEAGRQAGHG